MKLRILMALWLRTLNISQVLIDTIEYDYPTFHLSMDCFWCEIVKGELVLKEHESARWVMKEQLREVSWLPADVMLIEKIMK